MKKIFILIVILFLFSVSFYSASLNDIVKDIHWYGQACIKIETKGINIYIDPYKIKKDDKADIILITHSHQDHYSPNDIKKLMTDDQVIIAPFDINGKNTVLTPNKTVTIKGIKIETVPAYNIKKTYHPKSNNNVGYIITIDGIKIYHAGDTERIPEMKNIDCDIALIPIGQTYTMNSVEDAINAVIDVKAKIAIPIHFGTFEGTKEDAEKFVTELNKLNVKSIILNIE